MVKSAPISPLSWWILGPEKNKIHFMDGAEKSNVALYQQLPLTRIAS